MSVPEHMGVYGGGRMGGGIAHAFLAAGSHVTVVESGDAAADTARLRIESSLALAAARGSVDDHTAAGLRLTVTSSPAALRGCELVVEAVPEDIALKKRVFDTIEQVAPTAWLATNTSGLSVDDIASAVAYPDRMVGLHFFNPVPVSDLVEVVVGSATDPDLVQCAQTWVQGLGKTAITVRDSPGFASSRLGLALALEAMRMLQDGVASAEDIDTAMTLGYKHQLGPLRTTDLVGLDVRLAIAEHLATELGDRFEPPHVLREKVAAGHVGRKAGRGFYEWT